MPKSFCANRTDNDEDAEKQEKIRRAHNATARNDGRGLRTQAIPAQLMDGAHYCRLGTDRYGMVGKTLSFLTTREGGLIVL